MWQWLFLLACYCCGGIIWAEYSTYCNNCTCYLSVGNPSPYNTLVSFLSSSNTQFQNCQTPVLYLTPICYEYSQTNQNAYNACYEDLQNELATKLFGQSMGATIPPSFVSALFGGSPISYQSCGAAPIFNANNTVACHLVTTPDNSATVANLSMVWIGPISIKIENLTIKSFFPDTAVRLDFTLLSNNNQVCNLFQVDAAGVNFQDIVFVTNAMCLTDSNPIQYNVGGGEVTLKNVRIEGPGAVVFNLPPQEAAKHTTVSIEKCTSTVYRFAVVLAGVNNGTVTADALSTVLQLGLAEFSMNSNLLSSFDAGLYYTYFLNVPQLYGCNLNATISNSYCDNREKDIQIFIIVCSVVLSVGVFFFVVHVVRNYRKKLHEPDEKKIN